MTLTELIEFYSSKFESKQRGDKSIIVLKDDAPEELSESVRDAHQGLFPNDWIYDTYDSIMSNLADYNPECIADIETYRHGIVDSLVEIYTYDLIQWYASSNHWGEYLTRAINELGATDNAIASAQYLAIDDIFSYVFDLLEDQYND